MLAKDLISDIIPALRTSDTGLKALNWMDVFRISHMPIVNNEEFLGLISDTDIYDLNMADEPIGNHSLSINKSFVYADRHIYNVIDLVSQSKLSIIPVLSLNNKYLGVITLYDLIHHFHRITAVRNIGTIVVLEMYSNDYHLSEISRIVEECDLKILSLYVDSPDDSRDIEVTIKLNSMDSQRAINSFNRFNYRIKAVFNESESMQHFYNERIEELWHYLNM